MTTPFIIWGIALIIYGIFWLWYVGFKSPLSMIEIDDYINRLKAYGHNSDRELRGVRKFLENDTGKSFAMVNLIQLKDRPDWIDGVQERDSSLQTLINYHKPFMKMMLKRGGMGIFQGRAAGDSVDVINIDNAESWSISGINRFRSRRDFAELLVHPKFHEKHAFKFAALNKSIASPMDPWFQLGGLPVILALILALGAAIIHIIIV